MSRIVEHLSIIAFVSFLRFVLAYVRSEQVSGQKGLGQDARQATMTSECANRTAETLRC